MKAFALAAIRFYQKHISPHKGYCCAYAAYTGDSSCSALGYRAIRQLGVWDGLAILDRRLARCSIAHRLVHPVRRMPRQRQAGFIDCGGCDIGGGDCSVCDLAELADCGGSRKTGQTRTFRKTRPENEDAIKRRSRLLRESRGDPEP